MQKDKQQVNGPRSSVYLLPNLLTTMSLLSGFYSIISSVKGEFFYGAVAIIVAAVFDGLDGRVARMTGTTSKFGVEYDSLCDLVSFGVAPALLVFLWIMQPYGRFGWLAAFLYVATTALRLARFNSSIGQTPKNFFIGLPCPAAAVMIATAVLFGHYAGMDSRFMDIAMLLMVYVLSYLMVSTHKYHNFKHMRKARTFQFMVFTVLLIMVVATEPQVTLFVIGVLYILSGPLAGVYRMFDTQEKGVIEKKSVV